MLQSARSGARAGLQLRQRLLVAQGVGCSTLCSIDVGCPTCLAALRPSPSARIHAARIHTTGSTQHTLSASGIASILAVEMYVPRHTSSAVVPKADDRCTRMCVRTLLMERFNVCDEQVDTNSSSMALTAVRSLLHRYGVRLSEIGHLQVGLGLMSLLDRSKCLKGELMSLLEVTGDAGTEGVDHIAGRGIPIAFTCV